MTMMMTVNSYSTLCKKRLYCTMAYWYHNIIAHANSYFTSSPVSTNIGDHLWINYLAMQSATQINSDSFP